MGRSGRRSFATGRLVEEALANLRARLGLTLALISTVTCLLVTTMVMEINAAVETRSYDRHLAALGYSVLMVGTTKDAPVALTAADCDALRAVNGVRAALWLGPARDWRWIDASGPPIPLRAIGGDVEQFLGISNPRRVSLWDGAPLLVDDASVMASGRIGGPFPVRLQSADGPAVSGRALVVSLTMLGSGIAGNAVIVTSQAGAGQPVDACLMIVDIQRRGEAAAAAARVYPPTSGYTRRWVLANADEFESPKHRFEHRQSQWLWLMGAAAVLAFWAMNLRMRRPEFSVYAISGARPWDLATLMATEFATILAVSVVLTAIVIGAKGINTGLNMLDASVGIRAAVRFLITIIVGSTALNLNECFGLSTSGLDALKDR